MSEQIVWGIHVTGALGDKLYLDGSFVGIGWSEVGDLTKIEPDRESFKAVVAHHFPERTKGYVINAASQLFRFVHELKPGDWVVYRATYFDGRVHVGRVTGRYEYSPHESFEYPNL